MKIGFIGCVDSSLMALKALVELDSVEISAVVTRKYSPVNADFADLTNVCIEQDIPYFYEDPKNREETTRFLAGFDLDVIYCFGWSYLLGKDLLTLTPNGVIGFHPAKLPQNRGRHPIIWALALGLNETASTFFRMDEGADSGPILSQELIEITPSDNACSLYSSILDVAKQQIINFTNDLALNRAAFCPQDDAHATYWRKRSRSDGLIDWRMSALSIHNLIRALSPPYPGAEFALNGKFIIVISSTIEQKPQRENCEPGKVLAKQGESLLIKCEGTSAIWLHSLNAVELPEKGDYL
jgi:methionyl-tRNA formyltransferase